MLNRSSTMILCFAASYISWFGAGMLRDYCCSDSQMERQVCNQGLDASSCAGECDDVDSSDELQLLKDIFQLKTLGATQPHLRMSHHDIAACCLTFSTLQSQHILLRL